MPAPRLAVVVPTRHRGASIVCTLETILANDHPSFEVRVVDQSADSATEVAVRPLLGDARLHYQRMAQQGVCRARNAGISVSSAELIVTTDDDCEVPRDWLQQMDQAFAMDARIGIVFGDVKAAPHDPRAGYIIGYARDAPFLATRLRDKGRVEGISGNMGIRRSTWVALGGFDESLGAGAPLRSAGETDLVLRALLAGHFVYETPAFAVLHKGLRPWQDGLPQVERYLFGIGAMFAKHVRLGHAGVLVLMAQLAGRWAFARPEVEFGFHPPRALRLRAFLRGLYAGLRTPVDRRTGHFEAARG